jgi:DNA-binding SARP family transcriptional activator
MIKLRIFGSIDIRGADGAALDALVTQQPATALLSYMAAGRPDSFFRRDRLVGMLWPENDQASARTNLRKALHQLRDAIGKDAIVSRGDEEIGLAPGAVWCDVAEFESAFQKGHLSRALELYDRGTMLDAFNLPNAVGFEAWVSETRSRLADIAAAASWRMAEHFQGNEEYTEAGRWARRTVAFRPDDERQLRNALVLLDQNGDRAGAIAVYKTFCIWLKRELDVEPSRETQQLVERIKSR